MTRADVPTTDDDYYAMNWDDLRFFLAVKRAGSLAAAARRLKVDQSTVSRRVASLEESLSAKLFERTPEGLKATAAGRAITSASEHAEQAICALRNSVEVTESAVAGNVRIATSPIFAEFFLVPNLRALYRKYPSIQLEVVSSIPMISLPRREADLAIRQLPAGKAPGSASVLAQKVADFGFALYGSESYLAQHEPLPEKITSLAGHDLVTVEADRTVPGGEWLASLDHQPTPILMCSTLHLVASGIAGGLGLGIIPCIVGDSLPGVTRISAPIETFAIWTVINPDAKDNVRIRSVKDALAAVIAENAERLSGRAGPAAPARNPTSQELDAAPKSTDPAAGHSLASEHM